MIREYRQWLQLHEGGILLGVFIGIELQEIGGAFGLVRLILEAFK